MTDLLILWKNISNKRRKQLVLLLFFMILTAFLEMLSVGSVLPFIAALINPEHLFLNKHLQPFFMYLGITNSDQMALPFSIVFIFTTLLAGIVRIFLLYLTAYLTQALGADLSLEIYKRTLYQDYLVHVSRNSSEIVNSIIVKTNMVIDSVVSPILLFTGSIFIIIALMSVLIFIDITVAIVIFISLSSVYFLVMKFTHIRLAQNGRTIGKNSTRKIKTLQEGLTAYKEVLLNQAQNFYLKIFHNADLPFRKALASSQFLAGCPKFAIEAFGMSIVAVLAYLMTTQSNYPLGAIPILSAFAIGGQRILPALQQAYNSYASYKSVQESFKDVILLLEQPLPEYLSQNKSGEIVFSHRIELKDVSFKYEEGLPLVLKNINLVINKGDKVGFIGSTGAGKSTLIDIIMGLLTPTEGILLVDGNEINIKNRHLWQKHISNVPQNINLSDTSVEENIAFGANEDEINHDKVLIAAKEAQLSKLISGWSHKYKSLLGEHGVRISGGQRQRIGVARALYKDSAVLVLDEATSALDNKTEELVIKSINNRDKNITILMIAHRITTLKHCNKIIELTGLKGLREVEYADIIK